MFDDYVTISQLLISSKYTIIYYLHCFLQVLHNCMTLVLFVYFPSMRSLTSKVQTTPDYPDQHYQL